jgi:NAD dependent epimerase/dehydratase family enzyme
MRFAIDSNLSGPVNVTAPQPVTNREFTRALAHAVHRPAVARVPAPAIKLLAGEFGDDILTSQNVQPKALLDAGFSFQHTTIDEALATALR